MHPIGPRSCQRHDNDPLGPNTPTSHLPLNPKSPIKYKSRGTASSINMAAGLDSKKLTPSSPLLAR
ncbi:hypothetical protein KUCAC02_026649, partial [Chaenocephalus aceratus]